MVFWFPKPKLLLLKAWRFYSPNWWRLPKRIFTISWKSFADHGSSSQQVSSIQFFFVSHFHTRRSIIFFKYSNSIDTIFNLFTWAQKYTVLRPSCPSIISSTPMSMWSVRAQSTQLNNRLSWCQGMFLSIRFTRTVMIPAVDLHHHPYCPAIWFLKNVFMLRPFIKVYASKEND